MEAPRRPANERARLRALREYEVLDTPSKALLERMHGRIAFHDTEGGGTTFFFELPRLTAQRVADPKRDEAARGLVCEDEPDTAESLRTLLGLAGFAVHIGRTLKWARRLLAEHRYAALALTLMLADVKARALIPELRAANETQPIPMLVVSFGHKLLLSALQQAIHRVHAVIPRLLHVEEDSDIRRVIHKTLPEHWHVVGADSLRAAKQAPREGTFDLAIRGLVLAVQQDKSGGESWLISY